MRKEAKILPNSIIEERRKELKISREEVCKYGRTWVILRRFYKCLLWLNQYIQH